MNKNELPNNFNQTPIVQGSEVMVVDGSYSLIIENKSKALTHEPIGLSDDVWTVVAVNVPCPTDDSRGGFLTYHNNCIIANNNGDIAFVSHINIRNIKRLF